MYIYNLYPPSAELIYRFVCMRACVCAHSLCSSLYSETVIKQITLERATPLVVGIDVSAMRCIRYIIYVQAHACVCMKLCTVYNKSIFSFIEERTDLSPALFTFDRVYDLCRSVRYVRSLMHARTAQKHALPVYYSSLDLSLLYSE